jgi:hypothetical protein
VQIGLIALLGKEITINGRKRTTLTGTTKPKHQSRALWYLTEK